MNIVEVLLDDARADDVAYMPNVRHVLARGGVTERNMFSSYPLCCPARASFFTGLLPHNHHVYTVEAPYGYRSFDDRSTVATSLHRVGYSTGLVGKYLNGYGGDDALAPQLSWLRRHPDQSLARAPKVQSQRYVPAGWDEWYGGIAGVACAPACGGMYNYFHYAYSHNGVPTSAARGAYSSKVIAQQADGLIEKFHTSRQRSGRPFFLSVDFVAPHVGNGHAGGPDHCRYTTSSGQSASEGYTAAPAWAYRVPAIAGITRGAGVLQSGSTEPGVEDKPGSYARRAELNPSELGCVRHDTQHRAAAVYATDRYIGTMIKTLKRTHEWRNTVFVFWSDNGYFQGEHHRMAGKVIPYEEVSRVPLVITGPGMRGNPHNGVYGGADRYSPMTVVDLSRTLVSMAGAQPPHDADGKDMTGTLTGRDTGWDVAVPLEFAGGDPRLPGNTARDPGFAPDVTGDPTTGARDGLLDPRTGIGLHTGRYYYLRFADGEKELYDTWTDPNEWSNLMSDPSWVATHGDLLTSLDAVWGETSTCAGAGCHPALPADLVVDRATNAARSAAWWNARAAEYGDNHPPMR